jgi:hypothetical protein
VRDVVREEFGHELGGIEHGDELPVGNKFVRFPLPGTELSSFGGSLSVE